MLKSLVCLAAAASTAVAATVQYNWDIAWVNKNPLGGPPGVARPVIGTWKGKNIEGGGQNI